MKLFLALLTFLTLVNAVTNVRTVVRSQCYFHMAAATHATIIYRDLDDGKTDKDILKSLERVIDYHNKSRAEYCTNMYKIGFEI